MKKVLFTLILMVAFAMGFGKARGQTVLQPGDIAFIGIYADGLSTAGEKFTFILLRNLDANTVIYFTDEGWDASISTPAWYGNSNDAHISWTVPSGGLSIGTIVKIENTSATVFTATNGTVSNTLSGTWNLASSGDQMLAYQSSSGVRPASPTFIAAVDFDYYVGSTYDGTDGWGSSYYNQPYCSYIPIGLLNGVNCVALINGSTAVLGGYAVGYECDNYKYTGTLTGTASAVRTAINTTSNWTGNEDGSMDVSSGYSSPINITADNLTITGISPISGSVAGETSVTITGINLAGATAVRFGATNASSFMVNSATQITATSPAGSTGTVHVTVTTPIGTTAISSSDQFTYIAIPEINVTGNGNIIADGDVSPDPNDHTDFGSVAAASGTISRTFTIQNTGSGTLTLGSNAVSVSGGQSVDFTITDQPATTIASGGNDNFTIEFDPSAVGVRSTTVNIANDDSDENPYNFSIQGTGTNFSPTDISLSASSVNENVAGNTSVGSLSSTDPDVGNTFIYSLVSGIGSTDNASFNISGSSLRINNSPDYETKSSYSVRIRTTDQGDLYYEKSFTITINDLNEIPTVTSSAATSISSTSATLGGNVTATGGANVTERGVYYSTTNGFADGAGTKVSTTGDWSATGAFTQAISGLAAGTTYYVKAFATNSVGTSYGSQVSFTTSPTLIEPGNALDFDGTNDYVNLGDKIEGLSALTFETWVNYASGGISDYDEIFSKENVNSLNIWRAGEDKVWFHLGTGTTWFDGGQIVSNSSIPKDRWTHIAVTWDQATTTVKIYINGVLDQTAQHTHSGGSVMGSNSALRGIGGYPVVPGHPFKGKLDELRAWNVVRTQAEIQSDMVSAISTSPGLLCSFNFNEGTASGNNTSGTTMLTDLTGNGNNGTLTNFALSGTTSNWVESYAMVVPTATAATSKTASGFSANWTAPLEGTVNYYLLYVATDAEFANPVTGYNPKTVASPTITSEVTGLESNTTYYYRVRADKASVTGEGSYSNTVSVTTNPLGPTITTASAISIATTSATLGGDVTADGGASVSERGIVYSSTDATPEIGEAGVTKDVNGTGIGEFSELISGLTAGTLYYVRAYATNSLGTGYGEEIVFHTPASQIAHSVKLTKIARTSATDLYVNETDLSVQLVITDDASHSYTESFTNVATNDFGFFSVNMGTGTKTAGDNFSAIAINNNTKVVTAIKTIGETEWRVISENKFLDIASLSAPFAQGNLAIEGNLKANNFNLQSESKSSEVDLTNVVGSMITIGNGQTITSLPTPIEGKIIMIVNLHKTKTCTLPGSLGTIAPNEVAKLISVAGNWYVVQ